jgi:hypothetical protein
MPSMNTVTASPGCAVPDRVNGSETVAPSAGLVSTTGSCATLNCDVALPC